MAAPSWAKTKTRFWFFHDELCQHFTCGWFDLLCVLDLSNSRCFRYDLHLETVEDIAFCVYHCFRTMTTPPCRNTNGCYWSLNTCSTGSSKFLSMRSMWEWWWRFSAKTTKLPTPWLLTYPQTKKETFPRSRNRIASGFILYPFFYNTLHAHHHCVK